MAYEAGVKHLIYRGLDYISKKGGFRPKFRCGHYDEKREFAGSNISIIWMMYLIFLTRIFLFAVSEFYGLVYYHPWTIYRDIIRVPSTTNQ